MVRCLIRWKSNNKKIAFDAVQGTIKEEEDEEELCVVISVYINVMKEWARRADTRAKQ